MDKIEFKYVPLTFIKKREDIEFQIKNTLVFKNVLKKYNNIVDLGSLIIKTQYGYTASANNEGNSKLLRITDINNGKVNWDTVPYCNCDDIDKYKLQCGDVLIARTGNNISYLVENNVPDNAVFASYLIRIVCDQTKILPQYLFLFLNSYAFWPQILLKQRGALLQNVNANLMRQLLIPICPIDVQKEIVLEIQNGNSSYYAGVDKVISIFHNNINTNSEITHQLDLIKNLRQAFLCEAMQGLLVSNETSDNKTGADLLAEIQAEKAQLVKEKKIKKPKPLPPITEEEIPFAIPENWTWCRLGELTNIKSGKRIHLADYVKEGIPFLRSGEIGTLGRGEVIKEPLFISKEKYLEIKESFGVPKPGDILIACIGGSIGNTWVVDEREFYFKDGNLVLIESNNFLNFRFILYYLKSPFFWNNTILNATDSSYNALTIIKLDNAEFPLPPLEIQERIVAKLDELMSYCDALEEQVKQSQQTNELLLQQVLREALGA